MYWIRKTCLGHLVDCLNRAIFLHCWTKYFWYNALVNPRGYQERVPSLRPISFIFM